MGVPRFCVGEKRLRCEVDNLDQRLHHIRFFLNLENGKPRDRFSGTKGIRHGDPLSKLLFVLIADALSQRIQRGVGLNFFRPLVVRVPAFKISHLQFTDDTLIFGEADMTSWGNLLSIVDEF